MNDFPPSSAPWRVVEKTPTPTTEITQHQKVPRLHAAGEDPHPIEIAPSERRGISVDLDGNIWSTARYDGTAYRYNPTTGQIDSYAGLIGPYTYSDMTGWGLQSVSCGPAG